MSDSPPAGTSAPGPGGQLPERVGRYEVLQSLGRGATGRVLLARDPVLDRNVAIKFLREDLRLGPEERESLLRRMRQEAKASARVSHPHLVSLFDMGEEADIGVYLVFEHAEGVTLKARVARGPLPAGPAAQLALELGDALTTAHRAGVLHRDVKPENIILTKTGAKIADFGVARVPESTLTKSGGLLGTPAYSAPESVTYGEHSPASDQFSLAATLYEALSGHRAFPGDDAVGVAMRIQTEEPLPIAGSLGLDPAVDGVLARALHKKPSERFTSCAEMGHALADALTSGERPSRVPLATVPDSRHRRPLRTELGGTRGPRLVLGGMLVGALATLLLVRLAAEFSSDGPRRQIDESGESVRGAWISPDDPSARAGSDAGSTPSAAPSGSQPAAKRPAVPSGVRADGAGSEQPP